MRGTRPRRPAEAGFAVIEAIVAAAIIAGMMAMMYRTIASDALAVRAVRDRREAALLAQSVMDGATGAFVAQGASRGRWHNFGWQVAREPYGVAGARDGGPAVERFTVRVADLTTGRPLLTLDTLRLAQ